MTDIDKVRRGLESHSNPKGCVTCDGETCPYYLTGDNIMMPCSSFLAADALNLLKAPEAVKPIQSAPVTEILGSKWFVCESCKHLIRDRARFCENCGRPVKWEELHE